jgi:GTPase
LEATTLDPSGFETPIMTPEELRDWAGRVTAGDRRAIAQAISAIEAGEPNGAALLRLLFPRTGETQVIGITGSPGVGKSTLVEKLAAEYRRNGRQVGIIAVDPTSPFSGGAILGDRVRMQSLASDDGVYIRSMATRGELGGLAPAAHDVVTVLEAAGCGTVLVETVGVGQDEVEVAHLADVTVLVMAPGMGDDVQTFKAGVMEIADIFAVNKADQPGADRVGQQLTAMLSISPRADGWRPPIVSTVASTGAGVSDLRRALDDFAAFGTRTDLKRQRQRGKWRARLRSLLRQRLFERVWREQVGKGAVDRWVDEILERRSDPQSVIDRILYSSSALAESAAAATGGSLKIDHLGIAVKSLEEAIPVFRRLTGSEPTAIEEVGDQKVRVAVFRMGESRLELLEPTAPDSPVARFLEKGGKGVHHLTLGVHDLGLVLAGLERDGFRLIDREPRTGAAGERIAFIHPSSTAGVLVELVEERVEQSSS